MTITPTPGAYINLPNEGSPVESKHSWIFEDLIVENARLRAENERLKKHHVAYRNLKIKTSCEANEEYRQRIAKLEEALRKIDKALTPDELGLYNVPPYIVIEIARTALEKREAE